MRRYPTLEKTIEFIRERAPLGNKPFFGRRFPYHLVEQAVEQVHDEFPDLHTYDVQGTQHLWREEEFVRYDLARSMTHHLLNVVQEGRSMPQVLSSMTKEHFTHRKLNRYGTTCAGMLEEVYHSPYRALRDLIENDQRYAQYNDFMPYDMRDAPKNTWTGPETVILARQLTKQWLQERGDILALIPQITLERFTMTPANRYGTNLAGMVCHVYGGSAYRALKDLFMHDDEFVAYRDLAPYDLTRVPINTWKDHATAREATKRLLLSFPGEMTDILPSITIGSFETLNRYGATLYGMLMQAYHNSPYAALRDLIENDHDFARYDDFRPYDMKFCPQNTWVRNGKRNLKLAREATKQLLQVNPAPRREDFMHTPINRYGTTLGGMLMVVYNNNVSRAVADSKSYK